MKGDYFILQRWADDGLWHWELHKGYSPHGAIAQSSQGYQSPSAAERSIRSALNAFRGARDETGLRIEKRRSIKPPRKTT